MAIVKRLDKGSALTYAELDGNFDHLTAADAVIQADVNAHEARTDNPHTVTKTQVGLGNVDNTSDIAKPVSTLTQAAIDAHVNDSSAAHAASAISFTQVGTGALANTVDAKLKQVVSVKDFGALGDNSTDDTAAIQAAIDHAETLNCALFIPAGTYICSSAITYTGTANYSLSIYGEGPDTSRIVFTGATNGIVITFADWRDGIFDIRNIGIFANHAGATTALTVTCTTYTSAGTSKGPTVDNVYIAHKPGTVAANNYWTNGVYFKYIPHPVISNCWIQGSNATTPVGIGIQFDTNVITPIVTNSHIYYWSKGIYVNGAQTEGVHVSDTQVIACYDGFYADASGYGTDPAITIMGSSFDNDHYGIYLKDRLRNIISGCDFYRQANDTAGYCDVYLDGASNTNVFGCSMYRDGGGTNAGAGIYATGTIDTLNIFGNYARDREPAIYIGSSVARVNIWGNDFDGITTEVDDNTVSGNKDITVIANKHAMNCSHTLVKMDTGGATLTTGSDTKLANWVLVEDNGGGVFDSTGKAKITVPAGARKVIVRAQIVFDANATGYRRAYIYKSGETFSGMPWVTQPATSGVGSVLNLISAPILVTSTDYFEVYATQSSGGDLAVSAGVSCWFSVEVVA